MTGHPIVTVRVPALFTWEQHDGGGCRCCCAIYHRDRSTSGISVCMAAAEPGLLITVDTGAETSGPLPVCRRCYSVLAA